jgi:hypothetical protein
MVLHRKGKGKVVKCVFSAYEIKIDREILKPKWQYNCFLVKPFKNW